MSCLVGMFKINNVCSVLASTADKSRPKNIWVQNHGTTHAWRYTTPDRLTPFHQWLKPLRHSLVLINLDNLVASSTFSQRNQIKRTLSKMELRNWLYASLIGDSLLMSGHLNRCQHRAPARAILDKGPSSSWANCPTKIPCPRWDEYSSSSSAKRSIALSLIILERCRDLEHLILLQKIANTLVGHFCDIKERKPMPSKAKTNIQIGNEGY